MNFTLFLAAVNFVLAGVNAMQGDVFWTGACLGIALLLCFGALGDYLEDHIK